MITNSRQHARGIAVFTALIVGIAAASATAPRGSADQMATTAAAAQIVPPSSSYRFPDGQTYVYSVEWHMFNAGIARVSLDAGGSQQRVTATADSLGVVNLIYTVHDRFSSYFDPHSFCSQRIVKHSEEGKRRRDSETQFEYARRKAVLNEKNLKTGENKHLESDIPDCITDVVTGFYYLASQPLAMGSHYTFPVSDGAKTTSVTARVDLAEQVKVPAGIYQTLRLVAEPISGPLKGKAKVSVWFSNDANHVPVQMRAKLGWGTLLFRLQRLEKK